MKVLGLFVAASLATAAFAAPQKVVKGDEIPRPVFKTTRQEILRALIEFEDRFLARGEIKDEKELARINRDLDDATRMFFFGRAEANLERLHEVTRSLATAAEPTEQTLARSLRVDIDPPVLAIDAPRALTAHVTSFYAVKYPGPQSIEYGVRLEGPGGAVLRSTSEFKFTPGDASVVDAKLELIGTPNGEGEKVQAAKEQFQKLAPGVWKVTLVRKLAPDASAKGGDASKPGDVLCATTGSWFVVPHPLDGVRSANRLRLDKISTQNQFLRDAIATCSARNDTLTDTPDPTKSSQFLLDPTKRAAEVADEVASLEKGIDPYLHRIGDTWRIVPEFDGGYTPMRVYAPKAAKTDALPLVIALNGAGGDENSFFETYGRGRLVRLAEEKGFLLACPAVSARPGFGDRQFDALLATLSTDYQIDARRIYVLGHSIGAAQAAKLNEHRGDKIAAMCFFNDGNPDRIANREVPILVFGGELDLQRPAETLQKLVSKVQETARLIEFRAVKNYGFYLLTQAQLGAGVEWLLAKRIS